MSDKSSITDVILQSRARGNQVVTRTAFAILISVYRLENFAVFGAWQSRMLQTVSKCNVSVEAFITSTQLAYDFSALVMSTALLK